jgi:probable HAF family extracellular repeat protein
MQIRILGSLLGNGTDGNFNGTSFAYGINASGQIVGKSSAKGEVDRAFITNADGKNMRDLGSLKHDGDSQANNINSRGQVVGWSVTDNFEQHAFVTGANGNNMRDLNLLVKKPIGIVFKDAESINDRGQIIAEASNSFCFLLTPRPTTVH